MNVLVIAPHPDDEAIGCGGTICLHKVRENRVTTVFLTSGEMGLKHVPVEKARAIREQEAESAAEVLGVKSLHFLRLPDLHVMDAMHEGVVGLRALLRKTLPERIYLPHARDSHPDHQACLPVVRAALTTANMPTPLLLSYEIWTPLLQHDDGEDISEVMTRKLKAVRCYRSQIRQLRYDLAVKGLNQYRGALCWKTRFAEVFLHESVTECPTTCETTANTAEGAMQR